MSRNSLVAVNKANITPLLSGRPTASPWGPPSTPNGPMGSGTALRIKWLVIVMHGSPARFGQAQNQSKPLGHTNLSAIRLAEAHCELRLMRDQFAPSPCSPSARQMWGGGNSEFFVRGASVTGLLLLRYSPSTTNQHKLNLTLTRIDLPCNYWQTIPRRRGIAGGPTASHEMSPGGPFLIDPGAWFNRQKRSKGHSNKCMPPPQ